MHVHLSFAENSKVPFNAPTALPVDSKAMTWPLLPGESVTSLAGLFYPNNPALQQRFISKTLQLSQSIQPQLTADAIALQPNLIVIPELKYLVNAAGRIRPAAKSNKPSVPLQMSYGLKDAAEFIVPQQLQAQYLQLFERNELLKSQLAKLNEHLGRLQQTLAALTVQAQQLFTINPVRSQQKPNPTSQQTQVKLTPIQTGKPINENISDQKVRQENVFSGTAFWIFGLLLLVAAVLISFAHWYGKRKSQKLYLAAVNTFEPIILHPEESRLSRPQAIDEVDFSLTQNGMSDSMSVTDLSQYDVLEDGADGELVLEQAKIYAHIGRSDEAIDLLRSHIDSKPKASLHHWLYLLDMYREAGQKEAFTQYALLLHQHFNVMTPLWVSETEPINLEATIEAFPHIVQQLTNVWADPKKVVETQAYLEYLLTDNRDSVRTGFSMEVFQEIILLRDILAIRDKFNDAVKL
jgi:tetratricopeptide (TPR) repeat protein